MSHEPKRYEMKGYPICDHCGDALNTCEEQEQEMCESCYKVWQEEEINWDVNKSAMVERKGE